MTMKLWFEKWKLLFQRKRWMTCIEFVTMILDILFAFNIILFSFQGYAWMNENKNYLGSNLSHAGFTLFRTLSNAIKTVEIPNSFLK